MTSNNHSSMPSSSSSTSSTSSTVVLSKSQKKRMKRNAAKSRKAAVSATVQSPIADASINPNDVVRLTLVNMGYGVEEINLALDEMWNLSLKYDEVDSVLNYLAERKNKEDEVLPTAVSAEESAEESAAEIGLGDAAKEDAETVSTAASNTPTKSSHTIKHSKSAAASTVTAVTAANTEEALEALEVVQREESVEAASPSRNTQRKRKGRLATNSNSSPVSPRNDLGSKLDTVANADSLLDAISALTQWVNTAATIPELKEFCSGSITRALIIVVRRSIDPSQNVTVIPQLLDLLCSILRRIGFPTRDITSSAKILQATIVQSRSTLSSNTQASIDLKIADAIAHTITALIFKMVDRVNLVSQDGSKTIKALEVEIEGLISQLTPVTKGERPNARELVSNRDCNKIAAEKYSKILHITMQGANNNTPNNPSSTDATNGHSTTNTNTQNDLMISILGDQYESISASKLQQKTLTLKLAQATSSNYTAREQIVSTMNALTTQRNQVDTQLEELKLEMHRLTLSQSSLTQQIDDTKLKLTEFDASLTGEARQIKADLKETTKVAQVHDKVVEVVNQLDMLGNTLNKSLDSFLNKSADKMPLEDTNAKAANVMELYLLTMKKYFDAEVRMVGFLRERAISLEQKVPSLEIEIQECTAMGMTRNVSEMTKNLNEMVQNVSEDRNIVDSLRREAVQMRQDLMERSEQYLDMINMEEVKPNDFTSHLSLLETIRQNAIRLELSENSRYTALMETVSQLSSSSTITPSVPATAPSTSITPVPITPATNTPAAAVESPADSANGTDNPVYSEAFTSLEINTTTTSNENNDVEIPAHAQANGQPAPAPAPAPTPAPKRSGWMQVGNPKGPSKSFLDIQKEELSMK